MPNRKDNREQKVQPDTNLPKEGKKEWIKFFLAPLVTAVIMFCLQTFIGPKIEKEKLVEAEIWKQKKDACIQAADLVSELYQTLRFNAKDTSTKEFDRYDEVNRIYFKLLVLCEDEKIPASFWRFFDNMTPTFSPSQRGEFFLLLKEELVGESFSTPVDEIPILKSPKNMVK